MANNTIKSRLDAVTDAIREAAMSCDRDPSEIGLVAISKKKPPEMITQAHEVGVTVFGENYIQEARDKYDELSELGVFWHFTGKLQSNKAKYAVKIFELIHSVDSIKLAREINKQAKKIDKIQDILIQINISGEDTKSGTTLDEAASLVEEASALTNVRVKGLMTLPSNFADPEGSRPSFRAIRELKDKINQNLDKDSLLTELSMGMTGDYKIAIQEGATLVRIGTAIFGPRT